MRQLDSLQGLGDRADLIELNEDGITAAELDPFRQALRIGYEQIVPNQLNPAAELLRHQLPAFPVLFIEAVLNGINGVLAAQILPMRR